MKKDKNAISKYKAIKRRDLKSKIDDIQKANNELLKLLAYDKSLDDKFLKTQARENLKKTETLTSEYSAIARTIVDEKEVERYFQNERIHH